MQLVQGFSLALRQEIQPGAFTISPALFKAEEDKLGKGPWELQNAIWESCSEHLALCAPWRAGLWLPVLSPVLSASLLSSADLPVSKAEHRS